MVPPITKLRPIVSQFIAAHPFGAAFLGSSLAAVLGVIYTLLTTDTPWPDAVHVGIGAGGNALIVLCLAVMAALLVCIPVLPAIIIVTDAVRGIVDGLRSARTVDPPHE